MARLLRALTCNIERSYSEMQTPLSSVRITIREVAKLAGVSIATVSHVMNSKGKASSETEQRVRFAIQALEYTPNSHARELASWRIRSTDGTTVEVLESEQQLG